MGEERAIAHLEAIRQDIRDEIKRRIEQRDRYSVQLTVALTAIVAVSFSGRGLGKVLIAAPLVSVYFTMLILYSYRVHRVAASFLREKVEPELARRCGTPPDVEWETYYQAREVPGIRRWFFLVAMWMVCLASLAYLWLSERSDFETVLGIATLLYLLAAGGITRWDFKGKNVERAGSGGK